MYMELLAILADYIGRTSRKISHNIVIRACLFYSTRVVRNRRPPRLFIPHGPRPTKPAHLLLPTERAGKVGLEVFREDPKPPEANQPRPPARCGLASCLI